MEHYLLSLCIAKAWEVQTLALPNPAVGAMVLDSDYSILSLQAHQRAGTPHAEILALLQAYEKLTNTQTNLTDSTQIHTFLQDNHNGIFYDKTLVITLEPCNHYGKTPPCAKLLSILKPQKIIIGARDEWGASSGGIQTLKQAHIDVCFLDSAKARDLLLPFLCLRNTKRFILFKLATRLNGDYKSGIISCEDSRIFTHNQRCVATSIIISGETLRTDKPTLDTRLASFPKHNPNVQILTRSTLQSSNYHTPLFGIKEREVSVSLHPNELKLDSGFHIIEGGFALFESLKDSIDMVLLHISPSIRASSHSKIQNSQDFEILHIAQLQKDALLWLKPLRS